MDEKEINAIAALIFDQIHMLSELRANTEAGRAGIDAEIEFLRGIVRKLDA